MPIKVRQAQTSFHHGQLSPLMAARYDKTFTTNGAESLLNMAPLAQGGMRTRPETLYLNTMGSTYGLLFPFVFSPTERYAMHVRVGAIDVYGTTGQLLNTVTVSGITSGMITERKLNWAHDGNTMILCHEDLQPQVITRTGSTTFTQSAFSFEAETTGAVAGYPIYQPFYKYAPSSVTVSATATSGAITLTTSDSFFTTGMVGNVIRKGGKQIVISTVTSGTISSGAIKETLASTNATEDWDEQVFSTYRGWPIDVTFFPDRLVFWGAKSRPSGIWLSKIGAYYNFDVGSGADDEAIWEGVAGARARYACRGRFLTLFGDRSFYYVPTSATSPLTPGNFSVLEQQPYGAAQVKPRMFDEAFLFVQNTNSVAREALWEDTLQAYSARPVSLLANDLVIGGSTYSAPMGLAVLYGRTGSPEQYAMLLKSSGQISCFHSVREEKLASWTPWQTDGTVVAIADCDTDVFTLVERELTTGTAVLTLEKFSDTGEAIDCQIHLDAGTTAGANSFSGATQYVGQTVSICSQGHYLGTATVSTSGAVTIPDADLTTTGISVGLSFPQQIKPMPAHFDLPDGTSKGKVMGLVRAHFQVDRSAGFTVSGQDVYLDFAGDAFDEAAPTKTGLLTAWFKGYDENAQCTLNITTPAKVTVLGLTREVQVNE